MKKILLIGNGAREHAIAETLLRSKHEVQLYVVGGARNPVLVKVASDYLVADVCNIEAICEFAAKIDDLSFAIIGPEAPIAAGVVDALKEMGVASVAPLEVVGQLECSKSFARDLLAKYQIPGNPKFKVFTDKGGIREYMEDLGKSFVVKADGLKGGKGVKVSGDHLKNIDEGVAYAEECIEDAGLVVVEEKLIGQEFSVLYFCDGKTVLPMPAVQDHKRAYDNDEGPNTGGMGSYSDANGSLPFLWENDLREAQLMTEKVVKALVEETGVEFKGIIYGGFIAVRHGVRLIEYNVRFGDPEAMNILPLLKTDFVDICEAIVAGKLKTITLEFEGKATVCKYVVPEGYPVNSVKGEPIVVNEQHLPEDVKTYYASVDEIDGKLLLGGSRAVAFVGIGDSIEAAEKVVSEAVEKVDGPVFYRTDIGTESLIKERIDTMHLLREQRV